MMGLSPPRDRPPWLKVATTHPATCMTRRVLHTHTDSNCTLTLISPNVLMSTLMSLEVNVKGTVKNVLEFWRKFWLILSVPRLSRAVKYK